MLIAHERQAERIQFLEEKRSWQVQAMLTDPLPSESELAGPSTSLLAHIPPPESPRPSPQRSHRKSPRKAKSSSSTLVNGVKKPRPSRRSSAAHKGKGKEKASSRVVPSYETEVIPPSPSLVVPSFKTNMTMSQPKAPQVIAPAFVLPPPSPAAQLPPRESLLSATLVPPFPKLSIPGSSSEPPVPSGSSLSAPTAEPMLVEPSDPDPPPDTTAMQVPTTPGSRRPFPMAKPFATHMVHAYSPVKPSPLSRILMLGNSPDSPEPVQMLDTLAEEDEGPNRSPTPAFRRLAAGPAPSLAMELGIAEDDEEDAPHDRARDALPPRPGSSLGRYPTVKDKGKGRAQPTASRSREPSSSNAEKKRAKSKGTNTAPLTASKVIGGGVSKRTTRSTTKAALASGAASNPTAKSTAKAGPRRVPIGSAEAAPAPAWRG